MKARNLAILSLSNTTIQYHKREKHTPCPKNLERMLGYSCSSPTAAACLSAGERSQWGRFTEQEVLSKPFMREVGDRRCRVEGDSP